MKIKASKHVAIRSGNIANGAPMSWRFDINNVVFIPDVVVVKAVALKGNNTLGNYEIRTNLIDQSAPLAIVGDAAGNIYAPNVSHVMRKPVQGSYDFALLDNIGGVLNAPAADSNVFIHLVFIQYE
jgi:hypothetical protein